MKLRLKLIGLVLLSALAVVGVASAANVGFVSSNIWLSDNTPIAGDSIKIYSVIVNDGDRAIEGNVNFYDNGQLIGEPISFHLAKDGSSYLASIVWVAVEGNHQFKAELSEMYAISASSEELLDSSSMSQVTSVIFIDIDTDQDGLGDQEEIEQGTDPEDADTDDDGDIDSEDPNPTNPKVFSGPDNDGDLISDKVDTDLDNDGLYNWEEDVLGTNQRKYDTDGDGYNDKIDAYPTDSTRWEKAVVEGEEIIEVKSDNQENDVHPQVLGVMEESDDDGGYSTRSKFLMIMAVILFVVMVLIFIVFTRKKKDEKTEEEIVDGNIKKDNPS